MRRLFEDSKATTDSTRLKLLFTSPEQVSIVSMRGTTARLVAALPHQHSGLSSAAVLQQGTAARAQGPPREAPVGTLCCGRSTLPQPMGPRLSALLCRAEAYPKRVP